jgi:cell division protein FtsW (lipid II flippase)
MMNKQSFLDEVLKHIRSKEAKEIVSKELEQHVNNNIQQLLSAGETEIVAEQKAVEKMGSPLFLGTKFNKLYNPKMDWVLVSLFLLALGLGFLPLIVISGDNFHLNWMSKLGGIIAGILIVVTLLFVNYKSWERKGWLFFTFGTFLLIVAFSSAGYQLGLITHINGRPYFKFGSFSTDTSIVLPIYLLAWASFLNNHKIKTWLLGILFVISSFLLMGTLNLSLIVIYMMMVFMMYIFSGRKHIVKTTIGTAVVGIIGTSFIWDNMLDYQKVRFTAFLDPDKYPTTSGYMYIRAQEILNETNWGFQSIPKEGLPISGFHTDFIFLTLTYALGWGFALFLLAVLSVIVIKMALMTIKVKDDFGKLLIIGGLTIYSVQLFYNVGMIFGLFPIIGISLPFISYGTIPIIINSMVIGVALSIHRRRNLVL